MSFVKHFTPEESSCGEKDIEEEWRICLCLGLNKLHKCSINVIYITVIIFKHREKMNTNKTKEWAVLFFKS